MISALTGDDQTQIVSMQTIREFVDRCGASRGVILQHIFHDRRSQPRRKRPDIQTARIRRPCQEALGSCQNQSIDLLLVFAQTDSRPVVAWPYAITIFRPSSDHLTRQFDEKAALWLPVPGGCLAYQLQSGPFPSNKSPTEVRLKTSIDNRKSKI